MPGRRATKEKLPLESVGASRDWPVSEFFRTSWTPGMTVAEESWTLPTRDPYRICAWAGTMESARAKIVAKIDFCRCMTSGPLFLPVEL